MKEKEHDRELQPIDEHFVDDMSEKGTKSVIEFSAARLSVMENEKRVRLNLIRYGKTNARSLIRFVYIYDFWISLFLEMLPVGIM